MGQAPRGVGHPARGSVSRRPEVVGRRRALIEARERVPRDDCASGSVRTTSLTAAARSRAEPMEGVSGRPRPRPKPARRRTALAKRWCLERDVSRAEAAGDRRETSPPAPPSDRRRQRSESRGHGSPSRRAQGVMQPPHAVASSSARVLRPPKRPKLSRRKTAIPRDGKLRREPQARRAEPIACDDVHAPPHPGVSSASRKLERCVGGSPRPKGR